MNDSLTEQKKGEKIVLGGIIVICFVVMMLSFYSGFWAFFLNPTPTVAVESPYEPQNECPETRNIMVDWCIVEGYVSPEQCEEIPLVCDDLMDYIGLKYDIKDRTDVMKNWKPEK